MCVSQHSSHWSKYPHPPGPKHSFNCSLTEWNIPKSISTSGPLLSLRPTYLIFTCCSTESSPYMFRNRTDHLPHTSEIPQKKSCFTQWLHQQHNEARNVSSFVSFFPSFSSTSFSHSVAISSIFMRGALTVNRGAIILDSLFKWWKSELWG